jgi:hypothetical protein
MAESQTTDICMYIVVHLCMYVFVVGWGIAYNYKGRDCKCLQCVDMMVL